MDPRLEYKLAMTRRHFFGKSACGLGAAALGACMSPSIFANDLASGGAGTHGIMPALHHAPKAKRIIWLFMADGPSQLDLWDYKPKLAEYYDKDLPESVRNGQRITTMTSGQTRFPCAPSIFKFAQHGKHGAWISELLPHMGGVADDICIVKSMHTDAINHDPAITFITTGSEIPGRPSLGAWLSYGIGSPNDDLPAFVVLISRLAQGGQTQALFSRLWGSGFLATKHAGVSLRSSGDPVLYLSNPPGVNADVRRQMLDGLGELNQERLAELGDPEIGARIAQYEMAFRMQTSVPELVDISKEPKHVLEMYGDEVTQPGSFAYNYGTRQNRRGLWSPGGLAHPSRIARLVVDRVYSYRMGRQADAQADGDVWNLSTVLEGDTGTAGSGSRESTAGTRTPVPSGCRSDSRFGPGHERSAGGTRRWQECQTVPA